MTLPPGAYTPEQVSEERYGQPYRRDSDAVKLAARERSAQTGEPFSVAVRAVTGQHAAGDPRPAWAGGDGAEVPVTWAPFTPEQVASLNAFQGAPGFMPEFCYSDECPAIKGTGATVKREALDAREDGWHCPACGWTQDWAWTFLADGGWRDWTPPEGLTSGFMAATMAGPVRFVPSLPIPVDPEDAEYEIAPAEVKLTRVVCPGCRPAHLVFVPVELGDISHVSLDTVLAVAQAKAAKGCPAHEKIPVNVTDCAGTR